MIPLTQREAMIVQLGIMAMALEILGPKRADYSGPADPFGNFRSSEVVYGVPAWKAAAIRHLDKLARRRNMVENRGAAQVAESILDTWCDGVNYTCIEAGLSIEQLPNRDELIAELAQWAGRLPELVQKYLP